MFIKPIKQEVDLCPKPNGSQRQGTPCIAQRAAVDLRLPTPTPTRVARLCRTNAFSQRERDKLDNLVDSVTITTTPTPDGQTSVYVEAPTEVWTVLEGIAEREGTTAYEVMGDIAKQSLLRAMRKEKRNA